MERKAFILRANDREAAVRKLRDAAQSLRKVATDNSVGNFSIWNIEDLFLCYGEDEGDGAAGLAEAILASAGGGATLLCAPGSMRLMYHDIGIVRQDKSLIRHRVFATKLKPGCEAEYKRRHDALVEKRGDNVSEGPDSNFTIWYGAGYIFGYDEKVRAFDHEPTEAEKAADIAWETRQLEIMDWLTDDVDWITGQKHGHIERIV